MCVALSLVSDAEGTWRRVAQPAPDGIETMLLLSDGTVMAHGGSNAATRVWYRLTPDSTGGYTNGTWTSRASASYTRLYYSSTVLQDGRVFVAGAEYGNGTTNAEIYNPFNDTWAQIPVPSGLITTNNTVNSEGQNTAGFVDCGGVLLSNGNVLITPVYSAYYGSTVLFNPFSDSLSRGPRIFTGPWEDEASMIKLPDDSVLLVDAATNTSERYIPSLNKWVGDANVPVNLYDVYGREMGAAFLLPDGRGFFLGSTPVTALYTPSGTTNSGSWVAGPAIPAGLGAPDAPAAMMNNGKILCAFAQTPSSTNNVFNSPTYFFEYDYSVGGTGAFVEVHAPDGTYIETNGPGGGATYTDRMLDLPDGTVLYTDGGSQLYVYVPDGVPMAAGKPAIQSIEWNSDGTLHLSGARFNGISAGASYGDDAQMDSNYPLVRFTDGSGNVFYGTTHHWSSTGLMTGNQVVTTEALLPTGILNTPEHYALQVVVNGIASDPVAFNPLFLTFNPLTNTETVVDFSQIGGSINETGTVTFRINEYDSGGANDRYWTGSGWISDGNSPDAQLAAQIVGDRWSPAPGVSLPTRADTRYGPYFIRAVAVDTAGNTSTNEILVTRSETDTTPPVVTLDSIHDNDVITNAFLPALTGSAWDPETGVASVTVYLNRFSASGVLYWDGSAWSSTPAALAASYDAQTVTWQLNTPLPAGADLPNADYQVQIKAVNNEYPALIRLLGVNFSVDYHPVFVFDFGSQSDMNWSNPDNWDVGRVPTPDAIVVITNYSPDTTTLAISNFYQLDMSGGQLNSPGITVGKLNFSGGALSGPIVIATNGVCNWTGGEIDGSLTVPAGAALNLSGTETKTLGGSFIVAGDTTWTGTGEVDMGQLSVFENDGRFVVQNDAAFVNLSGGEPAPVFINNGTFIKTNSAGATDFTNDVYGGVAFDNNGTINLASGDLTLGGGGESTNGIFSAASGSHLDLTFGDFNWSGNLAINGAGAVRVSGANLTFAGATALNGTFEIDSGSAGGTSAFSGTGAFNWTGGSIGSGSFTLQSSIHSTISGTETKTLGGSFIVAGDTTWTGTGEVDMGQLSVFENDGRFVVQNDAAFVNLSGGEPAPVFINNGTFIKTNATGATTFDAANGGVDFTNTGTVDLRSGTLQFNGNYTTASSGQLDISIGGAAAGTQFGAESFGNAAAFDGALNVSLANGFIPANGQSFAIASYASSAGRFAAAHFPPLPAGSVWKLDYTTNALLLEVVPSAVPVIQNVVLTNGQFQFIVAGQTGSACVIEASTNLLNWAPILTNAPFNGLANIADPLTNQLPRRFYRAEVFP